MIQPTLIATNAALPVNTLQELVAMMKANPGKLRMSTAGAGTAGHFAGEMFIAMAGIKPVVIALQRRRTGDRCGRQRRLAMDRGADRRPDAACAQRQAQGAGDGQPDAAALLPNVPTVAESGYPGYEATGWGAIFVPNGTPQPIIDKLNATIAKVVTLPEVKKQFEEQGTEGASSTQAEMAKLLREDFARLGEVAKGLGLKVN